MAMTLATDKQANAIKQRMAEIRTELPYNADDARNRVRQLTDWKYHVAKHPLPTLAVAVAVGYALVPAKRQHQRIVVQRSSCDSDLAVPTGNVKTAKKGLVAGVFGTVATLAVKQATSFAASQISDLVSRRGKE